MKMLRTAAFVAVLVLCLGPGQPGGAAALVGKADSEEVQDAGSKIGPAQGAAGAAACAALTQGRDQAQAEVKALQASVSAREKESQRRWEDVTETFDVDEPAVVKGRDWQEIALHCDLESVPVHDERLEESLGQQWKAVEAAGDEERNKEFFRKVKRIDLCTRARSRVAAYNRSKDDLTRAQHDLQEAERKLSQATEAWKRGGCDTGAPATRDFEIVECQWQGAKGAKPQLVSAAQATFWLTCKTRFLASGEHRVTSRFEVRGPDGQVLWNKSYEESWGKTRPWDKKRQTEYAPYFFFESSQPGTYTAEVTLSGPGLATLNHVATVELVRP